MKSKTPKAKGAANRTKRSAGSQQRVVRPPFRLNQIIRHKVTGDTAVVVAVDKELLRAEPTTTAHFLYPPYYGWEVA